jgi:hypothetical protein
LRKASEKKQFQTQTALAMLAREMLLALDSERRLAIHKRRRSQNPLSGAFSMLGTILLVILILLLLGTFPAWPYSRGWGYGPSGGVGLIVLIVVILVLMRWI